MHRVNWVPLAVLAAFLATIAFACASYLPFFMASVWERLWAPEWWPAGVTRSLGQVGPWLGVSPWAALMAVPISSVLVLSWFILVVAIVLFAWRGRILRRG